MATDWLLLASWASLKAVIEINAQQLPNASYFAVLVSVREFQVTSTDLADLRVAPLSVTFLLVK